jgi:hypothetical protein
MCELDPLSTWVGFLEKAVLWVKNALFLIREGFRFVARDNQPMIWIMLLYQKF